ncbi:MAG: hypothetical protein U0Y82_06990 [Thermoleophilia bacterium]
MSASEPEIAAARFSWEEGQRRMAADTSHVRGRVVDAAMSELRRRVGVTFTLAQLVAAYREAPRWFAPLAHDLAPRDPGAWDESLTMDAAFARYARLAGDAPGRGRR